MLKASDGLIGHDNTGTVNVNGKSCYMVLGIAEDF